MSAWNADVTDDAANSSTGSQYACTLAPDFIELVEESVVILDLAELALISFIFFQRPIGRRGDDGRDRAWLDGAEDLDAVAVVEAQGRAASLERCVCFGEARGLPGEGHRERVYRKKGPRVLLPYANRTHGPGVRQGEFE